MAEAWRHKTGEEMNKDEAADHQSTAPGRSDDRGDSSLLLVAIKTDQHDIKRRLQLILAAAEPTERTPPAEVWAWALNELTANHFDRLAALIGVDAVRRLDIGDVVSQPEDIREAGQE